ncbi:hypothetical protein KXR83_25505 [Williamsia muralis]|uniref:hypothetical protein n=1 Tax=Williamsia marianensis TaxID=85044 RepID=UPI003F1732DA
MPSPVSNSSPEFWDLFAQPVATVLTGVLALGAAFIAWRGVKRTIAANAENLEKQLAEARAQQAVAQERAERQARNELLQSTVDLVYDIAYALPRLAVTQAFLGAWGWPRAMQIEHATRSRIRSARAKLRAAGMADLDKTVSQFEADVDKLLTRYRPNDLSWRQRLVLWIPFLAVSPKALGKQLADISTSGTKAIEEMVDRVQSKPVVVDSENEPPARFEGGPV